MNSILSNKKNFLYFYYHLKEGNYANSKFFFFLWPHLWHMELPQIGAESELQLLAYTTVIATQGPRHICNLCCSHGNARYLIQGARPGIEPPFSWTLHQVLLLFFFFFFFVFLRAEPMACGNSQAKGRTGVSAASLHHSHSNVESRLHLRPTS